MAIELLILQLTGRAESCLMDNPAHTLRASTNQCSWPCSCGAQMWLSLWLVPINAHIMLVHTVDHAEKHCGKQVKPVCLPFPGTLSHQPPCRGLLPGLATCFCFRLSCFYYSLWRTDYFYCTKSSFLARTQSDFLSCLIEQV